MNLFSGRRDADVENGHGDRGQDEESSGDVYTLGEGNGNPLQCSCLENPVDRGAWWAAIYGVTQSRTRLKRLSSSRHGYTTMGKIDS